MNSAKEQIAAVSTTRGSLGVLVRLFALQASLLTYRAACGFMQET